MVKIYDASSFQTLEEHQKKIENITVHYFTIHEFEEKTIREFLKKYQEMKRKLRDTDEQR